jgi:5'-3' exoribonuclease 1
MGVPKFYYQWVKSRRRNNLLLKYAPKYVSSISLDLNSLIHTAAAETYAYGENANPARIEYVKNANPADLEADLRHNLTTKIIDLLEAVQPRDTLCIAVDGVAPQAKMAQQRQRRYRSALESKSGTKFNSNAISPGTDFMFRLDAFLQTWIRTEQRRLPPKVIYSSHLVPGEGEHKIMDYMRSGEIKGPGAHIIFGVDADLIMLGLLSPLKDVYLIREDYQNINFNEPKIVNIKELRAYLYEELKSQSAVDDFIVMMFLLGNDFLPHSPALKEMVFSLELMFKAYNELVLENDFKGFTQGTEILWDKFNLFMKSIQTNESDLLKVQHDKAPLHPFDVLDKAFIRKTEENPEEEEPEYFTAETEFSYETFRDEWYKRALTPRQILNVGPLLDPELYEITVGTIEEMTRIYLNGIAWVLRYYKLGTNSINQRYVYPYFFTPLFIDMIGVMDLDFETNTKLIETDPDFIFTPLEQMLAILPLKSRNLVPNEIQACMDLDSSIIDMFPSEFIIDRQGTDKEHEGIVVLPFVDPDRIIDAVNDLHLLGTFISKYRYEEPLILNQTAVKKPRYASQVQPQRAIPQGISNNRFAPQRFIPENRPTRPSIIETQRFTPSRTFRGEGQRFAPSRTFRGEGEGQRFAPSRTFRGEGQRFAPSRTFRGEGEGQRFAPSRTIRGEGEGQRFVPSRTFRGGEGQRFAPSRTIRGEGEGQRFVPSRTFRGEGQRLAPSTTFRGEGPSRVQRYRVRAPVSGGEFLETNLM